MKTEESEEALEIERKNRKKIKRLWERTRKKQRKAFVLKCKKEVNELEEEVKDLEKIGDFDKVMGKGKEIHQKLNYLSGETGVVPEHLRSKAVDKYFDVVFGITLPRWKKKEIKEKEMEKGAEKRTHIEEEQASSGTREKKKTEREEIWTEPMSIFVDWVDSLTYEETLDYLKNFQDSEFKTIDKKLINDFTRDYRPYESIGWEDFLKDCLLHLIVERLTRKPQIDKNREI